MCSPDLNICTTPLSVCELPYKEHQHSITRSQRYFQLLSYFPRGPPQWLDEHVWYGTDFMPDARPDATLLFVKQWSCSLTISDHKWIQEKATKLQITSLKPKWICSLKEARWRIYPVYSLSSKRTTQILWCWACDTGPALYKHLVKRGVVHTASRLKLGPKQSYKVERI